ncbi:MAG TPA: hypothetical protein VFT22_23385 [Kofleriaceae bacterium]|nr:hypothetical protein [Kofleriaceae bacterium]
MTTQALTSIERADACVTALDDAGQAIARRVLLRLVSFGDGQATTRRPQPVSALAATGDPERLARTLRHLADARLVTIEGDAASASSVVDLVDDTLIAAWPRLQAWIRSHGTAEQLRRQLETDAVAWRERSGDSTGDLGLLDRTQLSELAGLLTAETRRDLGLSEVAESFLAASRAASRGRWWPGRAALGSALAVLLMLMLLATPIVLLFIVVLSAWLIHRFGFG